MSQCAVGRTLLVAQATPEKPCGNTADLKPLTISVSGDQDRHYEVCNAHRVLLYGEHRSERI